MKESPIKINERSIKDPRANTVESAINLKIQCVEKPGVMVCLRLGLFAKS